ncbi:MAG: Ada metal-binding domain-containing protein [Sulfobacillus sp.]
MLTVSDELYEAICRRTSTFDGRVYVGIVSTKIVCFPSCRSRQPKRENIRAYSTLLEATQDGFRPCKRCRPEQPKGESPAAELFRNVEKIMTSRLEEPLTLQWMAQELYISPTHLQRTIKEFTGLSPAEHLTRIRMARAQELLLAGSLPIATIAKQVGFRSVSHFTVRFQRFFNVSPALYRRARHDGNG